MVSYKIVNGHPWRCTDIGCDDFEKAKANRERVATTKQKEWWQRMETAITKTPFGQLPWWVPRGELPQVDLKQLRENGGGADLFVVDLTDPTGDVV